MPLRFKRLKVIILRFVGPEMEFLVMSMVLTVLVCHAQVGALKILREMCTSKRICVALKQFGGIMSLMDLLQDTDKQVQGLAAEVLSLLSRLSVARRMMRVHNGLTRLVSTSHHHHHHQ